MAAVTSTPRRQLGRILKRAREDSRMELEAVAAQMEWSRATMYRIERGEGPTKLRDVEALGRLYGVSDQMIEAMKGLAQQSRDKVWWHSYGDVIPEWFELYVGLEAAASHIRHYEPMLIPGLLQAPEYAAELFNTIEGRSPEEITRKTTLRMERQKLLTRVKPPPPKVEVFIEESVLHRQVGTPQAWRRQLQHLIDIPEEHDVTLRVLPSSHHAHRACMAGAFVILDFPTMGLASADPSTVYRESLTGALYLDDPREVRTYAETWLSLGPLALSERESRDLVAKTLKENGDA